MLFKTLAVLFGLCAVSSAQDPDNSFQVNNIFYQEQCGGDPLMIVNPRICFHTTLDINSEAIKGKGPYAGYSTSDGHGFSMMCEYGEYRRMYTKDYWISAYLPDTTMADPHPCCAYSVRRLSDNHIMSSGYSCYKQNNVKHEFPGSS